MTPIYLMRVKNGVVNNYKGGTPRLLNHRSNEVAYPMKLFIPSQHNFIPSQHNFRYTGVTLIILAKGIQLPTSFLILNYSLLSIPMLLSTFAWITLIRKCQDCCHLLSLADLGKAVGRCQMLDPSKHCHHQT
jgi:hypothetical protein